MESRGGGRAHLGYGKDSISISNKQGLVSVFFWGPGVGLRKEGSRQKGLCREQREGY